MTVWSTSPGVPDEVEPDASVLADAISSELAVDAHELAAEELGERSLRLRAQADSLAVAIARTDAAFEAGRVFRRLDPRCAKASQWLAKHAGIPVGEARDAYRRARRLALLPSVQVAVISGAISFWHACAFGRLASSPTRIRQLRTDAEELIEVARQNTAPVFRRRLRGWAEEHSSAEVEADASAADAGRRVSVSRSDNGQPRLDARLHPVSGTAVVNELGRIEKELFEADWSSAKALHSDRTRFEHLGRTADQRRADALVEMAQRSAATGPGATTRRPLVTLLVGFDAARTRVAEIEDGTYVTTDQALRAIGVADLERAVLGPDDRVAVSRRSRLFTGAERRAVEIRDGSCTETGCEAPPDRCDVDHVDRFEHGGPTEQANGRLRCVDHHEGRRAAPETMPLPWEHAEGDWDTIAAERSIVAEAERDAS